MTACWRRPCIVIRASCKTDQQKILCVRKGCIRCEIVGRHISIDLDRRYSIRVNALQCSHTIPINLRGYQKRIRQCEWSNSRHCQRLCIFYSLVEWLRWQLNINPGHCQSIEDILRLECYSNCSTVPCYWSINWQFHFLGHYQLCRKWSNKHIEQWCYCAQSESHRHILSVCCQFSWTITQNRKQ